MWISALLALDALFLLGNVAHYTSNAPDEPVTRFSALQWNGDTDGSYIEMFGHMQLFTGAVMLIFLCVVRRSSSYAAWAAVLFALVADDFLQIHERVGANLIEPLGLPAVFGLRPQDLGELLVWAVLGLILGGALLATYLTSEPEGRRDSRELFVWLCVLAVFAVGLDLLHIILEPLVPYSVALALTLGETAGELLGMTLILFAVHRMSISSGPSARIDDKS